MAHKQSIFQHDAFKIVTYGFYFPVESAKLQHSEEEKKIENFLTLFIYFHSIVKHTLCTISYTYVMLQKKGNWEIGMF